MKLSEEDNRAIKQNIHLKLKDRLKKRKGLLKNVVNVEVEKEKGYEYEVKRADKPFGNSWPWR